MKTLNLTVLPVNLNVAGIHETSDYNSKRLRVKTGDQDEKVNEDIMAYSHPKGKSNVQRQEIEGNISSPVSFDGFYNQFERFNGHLGTRLISLA